MNKIMPIETNEQLIEWINMIIQQLVLSQKDYNKQSLEDTLQKLFNAQEYVKALDTEHERIEVAESLCDLINKLEK